ncbi:hypothetical protein P879_06014 [Paragonimus westermani]|uniref:Bromo domain-containing protein n=1 Tax=Paragonimus westermani TaxID=34504 RepID=A0A8T0DA11_9TREM|nr:hypothetical protein P879_06014 [Paragonimus westermani]
MNLVQRRLQINVHGHTFVNTVENYEQVHGPVEPFMLSKLLRTLFKLVKDNLLHATQIDSLFGLSNYLRRIPSPANGNRRLASYYSRDKNSVSGRYLYNLHRHIGPSYHSLAHRNAVYCLQYDQRGEYVFTGSDDYTIKIWSLNLSTKTPCTLRHTLRGHVAAIIELAVSFDNHLLASVDSNCCLVIWCLRTGQPVVSVRGSRVNRVISGMTFLSTPIDSCTSNDAGVMPCGSTVLEDFTERRGWLAITSFGGFLHMIPYRHQIRREFALSGGAQSDRWTCCSLTLLPTVRFITGVEGANNVFWPSVVCMDVSPGSLMVATGCSDQCIRLYDLLNPHKPELSAALRAHEESVNSVAFSHCGLKLASGSSDGGSCWLWRFQAGKWRSMVLAFRKRVKCRPCLLAWSKSDRYLIASMKNGSVYVYFGESGRLASVIEGHEGAVHALSPSPLDDDLLATGGVDGRFQVWNIRLHRAFVSGDAVGSDLTVNRGLQEPLLCHYRYPPCQFDPDQGIVWQQFEPDDHLPIWQNSLTNRRLQQREQSSTTAGQSAFSSGARPVAQTARDSAPHLPQSSAHHQPQGGVQRINSVGPFKFQRITACRAAPPSEGVGFLVVTKSGLLSVFRPLETDGQSFSSDSHEAGPLPQPDLDSEVYNVNEQFFHWELDTAEWKEVPVPVDNVEAIATVAHVSVALGSPPASQSVAGLSGARYDRSGRNSRPNPDNLGISVFRREPPNELSSMVSGIVGEQDVTRVSRNGYRPPSGVCFEIIHASSQVPFHRLPPPYLTNLRGVPFPTEQQRQVPGRKHFHRPVDLRPSVTVDEELGEDIVVDDIQFCTDVPADYSPAPLQSTARSIPGKQYLWQSVWLNPNSFLIKPLSPEELRLQLEENALRYSDEVNFFSGHGDPKVTFGDEFINSLRDTEEFVVMQPQTLPGLIRHPTAMDFDQRLSGTENHTNTVDRFRSMLPSETDSDTKPGLSFLHSFLTTKSITEREMPQTESSIPLGNNTACPSSNPVASVTESISIISPTLEDMDDLDDNEDASEESEWSEHIDVDIGWWHRQRRRRHRRHAGQEVTNTDSISTTIGATRQDPRLGSTAVSSRNNSQAVGSTSSGSHRGRSSIRQRRLLSKRLRERRLAEARTERGRRKQVLRRSQRFQRRSTNQTDSLAVVCQKRGSKKQMVIQRGVELSTAHNPTTSAPNISISVADGDLISEQRERLKRRLLRSVDYALHLDGLSENATSNRVPLTTCPDDGYQGPDCEGQVYPNIDTQSSSSLPTRMWSGPHFDWLSTYHPVPTPYVPQLGDRVVYVPRGHQDYVKQAWPNGEIPIATAKTCNTDTSSSAGVFLCDPRRLHMSDNRPSIGFPWTEWPQIPAYVCGSIQDISYGILRISHEAESPSKRRRYGVISRWRKQSSRFTKRVSSQELPTPVVVPTSTNLNDDTFIRLVRLRIHLDTHQSYEHLGSPTTSPSPTVTGVDGQRRCLEVIYHDVDGVLDFVILRHLFDAALRRYWAPGDLFICPVGTVWWRGRVVQSVQPPNQQGDTIQPTPSCSATNLCGNSSHRLPDPWLRFLVYWLEADDTGCEPLNALVESSNVVQQSPGCKSDGLDRLSPWDMHPWRPAYPTKTSNGTPDAKLNILSGQLDNGFVLIPPLQIRLMYGTPTTSDGFVTTDWLRSFDLVTENDRFLSCLDKIMQLPVSEHFNQPVDLMTYPDYVFVNPYPVDLSLVTARLSTGFYRQQAAVSADLQQMLDNTVRYNKPNSTIVQNALLVHQLCIRCLQDSGLTADCVPGLYERLLRGSNSAVSSSRYGQPVTSLNELPVAAPSNRHLARRQPVQQSYVEYSTESSSGETVSDGQLRPSPRLRSQKLPTELSVACSSTVSKFTLQPVQFCSECDSIHPDKWVPTCLGLLKTLNANRRSAFFREPIEFRRYPDYSSVVSCPMDLSTVRKRLDNTLSGSSRMRLALRSGSKDTYRCMHECLADLRTIVSNSKLYNMDPDTAVFDDTLWLEDWITHTFLPRLLEILSRSSHSSPFHPLKLDVGDQGFTADEEVDTRSQRNIHLHRKKDSRRTRRMRQSNLACRKLALRKLRSLSARRKSQTSKGTPETSSSCLMRFAVHRTSSGRLVRPPTRDTNVVSLPSDNDEFDSDHRFPASSSTGNTTVCCRLMSESFSLESTPGSETDHHLRPLRRSSFSPPAAHSHRGKRRRRSNMVSS